MKKFVLISVPAICIVTLVGFAFTSSAENRELERQRFAHICASGANVKIEDRLTIVLWTFPIGDVQVANSIKTTENMTCPDPKLVGLWKQLQHRKLMLQSLDNQPSFGSSCGFDFPGAPKRVSFFEMIGVEAIREIANDGSQKLRVVGVSSGLSCGYAEPGKPIPYPGKHQHHSRNEFVNPEDIDWMYDLKDFSSVKVDQTEIP